MTQTNPDATTAGDICIAALKECGAIGVGQAPLAEDLSDAQTRLQWMLQQWERQRWLVFHLVTLNKTSNGSLSYTVGPGGDIDTGVGSARPDRIESAFLRQLTQSQPNQIDYPLDPLQSMEDYNRIALKQLQSFPGCFFYDSDWPLGKIYTWPVPQANIYGVFISVKAQLPSSFATQATRIVLPYEYYSAMLYNLAVRLRSKYQIPTFAGDPLVAMAKTSLNVLRGANAQIARLQVPRDLNRPGIYNIFSDRYY